MKNASLKKIGAIALAAVMAVTFAPVASLNAFAADTIASGKANEVTGNDKLDGTAGSYKVSEAYKVSEDGTNAIEFTKGNSTLDLNGKDVKIKVYGGATVTIKDSSINYDENGASKKDGTGKATVELGDKATHTAGNVVITSGDVIIETAADTSKDNTVVQNGGKLTATVQNKPAVKYTVNEGIVASDPRKLNANTSSAVGTNPVAVQASNSNYYVGNKTINSSLAGQDIKALNGAVEVTALAKDQTAGISDDATVGTSVKATAAKDLTLQKYVTTYAFKYTAKKNGRSTKGTATYVDTLYRGGDNTQTVPEAYTYNTGAFATGKAGFAKIVDSLGLDSTNGDSVSVALSSGAPEKPEKFDTAIAITYTFAKDWTDHKQKLKTETTENTWYTFDPSKYTADENGVAVIDGSKYALATQAPNTGFALTKSAASSVKVLRAVIPAGKDAQADSKATFTTNAGVAVSAPAELSLVQKTVTTTTGTKNTTTVSNWVGGSKAAVGGTSFDDKLDNGSVSAVALAVPQIAKDKKDVLRVTGVSDDFKSKTTVGSGVDYYRIDNTNKNEYAFGLTKVVTNELVKNAAGEKAGDVTFEAAWTSETVFASKGIKATVAGVKPGVTFNGEISATVKSTAPDGKKTWLINGGDAAEESTTVYRYFNKYTGDRVYTYNPLEIASLESAKMQADGWTKDTEYLKVLPATASKGVAVYRFRQLSTGGHLYTSYADEVARLKADKDWVLESEGTKGVAFKVSTKDDPNGGVPVYGLYKASEPIAQHFVTKSLAERDNAKKQGWVEDGTNGIRFYMFK